MHGLIALFTLSIATAGPLAQAQQFAYHNHANSIRHVRRHHARAAAAVLEAEPLVERDCEDDDNDSSSSCTYGQWNCDGNTLQRCFNDKWNDIQECSGDNVICSASADQPIGCVWTWSVSPSATTSGSTTKPSTGAAVTVSNSTDTDDCDEWETVECDADGTNCTEVTESATPGAKPTSVSGGGVNPNITATITASVTGSTKGHHGSATSTAAGTNSTGVTNSTGPVGGGNPSTSAPHYVIYADNWLDRMPSASELTSYNRFILAFWMTQPGPVDNAQAWTQFSPDYRQQVLDEYHAAGISLMVSAFGSTDSPTSSGADPTDVATRLAQFVKDYNLDGVDIDYEDMNAMNNNQGEAWLIPFQQTLRSLLPAGQYLISHAPVAPWFTTANVYASGAYLAVNAQTGDGIDFYNVQFYNQGNIYVDCTSLMTNSGSDWPNTSVMQINSAGGVPLDKIVVGKPMDSGAADNGYMDPSSLAQCIADGVASGWNGGVMFWEWDAGSSNSVMLTVKG